MRTWWLIVQTCPSQSKNISSFTRRSKDKEPSTFSSVCPKRCRTWSQFSRKRKNIMWNSLRVWKISKKMIEKVSLRKFLIWTRRSSRLKVKFKDWSLNWISWWKKKSHKLKKYRRIFLPNSLNSSRQENNFNPNLRNLKPNTRKSVRTLRRNKRFGKRTEPWWKVKSSNKPQPFKNWKNKDKLWHLNMRKSATRQVSTIRKL